MKIFMEILFHDNLPQIMQEAAAERFLRVERKHPLQLFRKETAQERATGAVTPECGPVEQRGAVAGKHVEYREAEDDGAYDLRAEQDDRVADARDRSRHSVKRAVRQTQDFRRQRRVLAYGPGDFLRRGVGVIDDLKDTDDDLRQRRQIGDLFDFALKRWVSPHDGHLPIRRWKNIEKSGALRSPVDTRGVFAFFSGRTIRHD